ncbi:MAG: tRNA (adenosine(37)-N6)-threonylcarbamoyltransferase complex dimerization subunit type 1 TsaB [Clostridia bacterium]|nr:tRNA (adenosine(37)-N6)-threonylcarbamoyltransferase complex dimerization subunit type 1 TsaB [Clostridia bacterium]
MLTFGIDTCCMASTAALCDERVLIAQTVVNRKKTHSEMMMPQIEQMFKAAEIDPSDVDVFAAAVGPGSFTGVRIGVATAKAMAQAVQKPCVAVSTLEALAHSSRFFDGIVSPILDARRDQVYNALFFCKKGTMTRLIEDRALALSDLFAELEELDKNVLFVGDGTLVFEEEIKAALGERAFFAPKTISMNLGGAVAEIGAQKYKNSESVTYDKLVPSYVRLSQAERDLLEKKNNA